VRTARSLEQPSLAPLLRAFAGRKVLVVGDLVADHYIYGETDRISREAPVLIVRYESAQVKLGGAANAAANLRAMGARVTAIGVIGRDSMGTALRQGCRAVGIRLATPRPGAIATETKTRILAGGLNTRRQQMLRLDRGQKGPLPEEVQAELAALTRELARQSDAVLVSDYGAGVLGPQVIAEAVAAARQGVKVCVDSRYNLASFVGATLVKPNEPELEAFVGLRTDSDARLGRAVRLARKRLGCQALLVTRGRQGMVLSVQGELERIEAHGNKEAVDVTGAGDTVGAALALSLAAGADFSTAARLANVAGALKVQKPGTATVSAAELAREIEEGAL
jgi:rfaE bifunctional protein kinase chain/domain